MSIDLIDTRLDVTSKQQELINQALSPDSIYIRMKDTLLDLIEKGDINGAEKGKIISETISQITSTLTSGSMSVALQWAAQEKELEMKKEELVIQVQKLEQEKLKLQNEVVESLANRQLKQAQLIREFGIPTKDTNGNVTSLTNAGKEYSVQLGVEADTALKNQSKLKIADDMLTSAKNREVLVAQKALHERQTVGFDDNKYQKLFDSQINAWGVMFSSGMLETKPRIINNDKVSDLYDRLTITTP